MRTNACPPRRCRSGWAAAGVPRPFRARGPKRRAARRNIQPGAQSLRVWTRSGARCSNWPGRPWNSRRRKVSRHRRAGGQVCGMPLKTWPRRGPLRSGLRTERRYRIGPFWSCASKLSLTARRRSRTAQPRRSARERRDSARSEYAGPTITSPGRCTSCPHARKAPPARGRRRLVCELKHAPGDQSPANKTLETATGGCQRKPMALWRGLLHARKNNSNESGKRLHNPRGPCREPVR
mmetsp:Transcript_79954/g.222787  ORF Transcript_79954/g.222787 Transcript_79954/m.222787 type:complete len:237 (+) Transcript_79954:564-1274(+)